MSVTAIVVSFNGRTHLESIIPAIKNQSIKVDEIIVVINGSNDSSIDWLLDKDVTIIEQDNLGNAGGQFSGLHYAYSKNYQLFWCLDHDIIPELNCLENLIQGIQQYSNWGFATSCILGLDNLLAYPNLPELDKPESILNSFYNNEAIPVLSASFGSLLINRKSIETVGYPSKDFFIWGEDAAFTLNMIDKGLKGFMVMNSNALHNQDVKHQNLFADLDYNSIKLKYGLRNMVYVIILRNKITYNSKFRGILSCIMFYVRILRDRKHLLGKIEIKFLVKTFEAFIKGFFFNPKVIYPKLL